MCLPLKRKLPNITSKIPPIIAMAVILLCWELVSITGIVPSYMLPSPVAVIKALVGDLSTILFHAKYTLSGVFLWTPYRNCTGVCICNCDGSFSCNGSGFLSDYDHYPDHSYNCNCSDPGAVDGVWNGTKDHTGSCSPPFFPSPSDFWMGTKVWIRMLSV